MCHFCGCQSFIMKRAEAVLKRAANIVEELGLTPENMDLFEDCEFICELITPQASLSATAPDIWETAQWVRLLHMKLSGGEEPSLR